MMHFETKETYLTWLGSAGFWLKFDGLDIMIDPVLLTKPNEPSISEAGLKLIRPYPFDPSEIQKMDYVLYTHPDLDHLGPMTAKVLLELDVKFIGPHMVYRRLIELGIPSDRIEVCRSDMKFSISGDKSEAQITVTPADHPWQLMDPKR